MSGIINSAGSKSGVIGTTELDYEEGDWTVTYYGATVSGGNTKGYYTKIGKRIWFDFYSSGSTFASSSGQAKFNLPFVASTATNLYPVFGYEHGNTVDGSSRGGYIGLGSNEALFVDAGGYIIASYIDGATHFMMVSGSYLID